MDNVTASVTAFDSCMTVGDIDQAYRLGIVQYPTHNADGYWAFTDASRRAYERVKEMGSIAAQSGAATTKVETVESFDPWAGDDETATENMPVPAPVPGVALTPKVNTCAVCGEVIPPTGKRGRPRKVHVECEVTE